MDRCILSLERLMRFRIRLGIPEVLAFWDDLAQRDATGSLNSDEQRLFKQIAKALLLLEDNPRHTGLKSHEIEPLSRRFGTKVFQSYLENRRPAAGRLFWAYGPATGEITILSIHPHPEDKKSHGYDSVRLSNFPKN